MTETRRSKNIITFIQTISSFVLSWKIINIYNDIARRYGNAIVRDFRKFKKLEHKNNKLKLDIDFLNNCKQLSVYPKFLIFKLPNVSSKDALSIRKRLLRSAINKCNKELQHFSKDLSLSENFLSKEPSTIDIYILTKSISAHNKKSLQKLLYSQQEKFSSMTRDCNFTANNFIDSQLMKLLLISRNMNYPRINLIYLKQAYTFQSNQIKHENPKSSLPLKRFIVHFLTTLNLRKPKVR